MGIVPVCVLWLAGYAVGSSHWWGASLGRVTELRMIDIRMVAAALISCAVYRDALAIGGGTFSPKGAGVLNRINHVGGLGRFVSLGTNTFKAY